MQRDAGQLQLAPAVMKLSMALDPITEPSLQPALHGKCMRLQMSMVSTLNRTEDPMLSLIRSCARSYQNGTPRPSI